LFSPPSPTAGKPSLVVLPFANLSPDPTQDYFVDGVTESLTTDLSRMAGIFVIGRNTAFTYKLKHRRSAAGRPRAWRSLRAGGFGAAGSKPDAHQRPAH
jgi:TolB-like protein